MAFPLSSASQSELSTGTNALPSWSFIETEEPVKGVVWIVRLSCGAGSDVSGRPASAELPQETSNQVAHAARRPTRETPETRARLVTIRSPSHRPFRTHPA